jgi:EAL domain-containing protein (putative c-di-GMP-specific phosphodiesterase class I)
MLVTEHLSSHCKLVYLLCQNSNSTSLPLFFNGLMMKCQQTLNYQPFININNGCICGAEALVRWQSGVLGLISPLDFIPIAEMNGMIVPIGEWVLRSACQQLKIWQDNGYKSFSISVNLSAKQLEEKNLTNIITGILNELNLEPQYLELELTESEIFRKEAIPIIHQFTEMGISLAIDDFGTGYSEFSNLKLFKVNKIKIDKIFIQDIDVSIDSRNIVTNTISLAKRMKIQCLAEGVETKEQFNFLKQNGCDMIQGFYFSRPLSARDFFELMRSKG